MSKADVIAFRYIFFLKLGFTPCKAEESHYEAWSYKKKKHKKITAYMKSV